MNNVTNLMILACLDGKVSEEEQNLINDIAHSYGLTEEEFGLCGQRCNESLKENSISIEVPESEEAKEGFLRNLVVTMMIDGCIDDNERLFVENIAERFGFNSKEVVDYLIKDITKEAAPKDGGTASQDNEALKQEISRRIELGKEALLKNDIPAAFDQLMEAALVDKKACILLMELFSIEKRIHRLGDPQMEKMQALAEKGYAVAQYALGRYHQVVKPDKESYDIALKLFNAAIQAGVPDAIAARALMYNRGELGEIDKDKYNQEMRTAHESGSLLGTYYTFKALIFGTEPYEANPQWVIDSITKWLEGEDSEDLLFISPVYYELLALAYTALNDLDKATEYNRKCVRMGRADLYSDVVIATCYDDDFEPIDEDQLLKALETGINMGDPYCYVLRADIYEKRYDNSDNEQERAALTNMIAEDLRAAAALGEGVAWVMFGQHCHDGDYGFVVNNEMAWDCFNIATGMHVAQAWTKMAEMIVEDEVPGERPSSDFLNYCRLMSVRLGDTALLPVLIYNYYKGTMRKYANEIKRYYLPKYEALSDEEKTAYFGTQFIAVIDTQGKADLVEFDLETEEWDELAKFIDADRLDAIRTEPLTNLGEEMGYEERITAWVDRNGMAKGLEPNPIGGKLYPGTIVGNMILTLEDSEYHPMSFDDLAELKEIVTALGATVERVSYNEFPDEESRNEAHDYPINKANFHLPAIPMYDQLTKQLWDALQGDTVWAIMEALGVDKFDDKELRARMEGRSLKVTQKVMPHLFELLNQVKDSLQFEHPVDFFVVSDVSLNAGAYVYHPKDPESPYIVQINSAMIETMTEPELKSVVGHELGHLLDNNLMLDDLIRFIFPKYDEWGMPLLPIPLRYKYFYWKQLSELFADRYGYLATKDIQACIWSEMKLKCGLKLDKMEANINAFIEENRETLEHYISGTALSLNHGYTHPVSPIRIEALNLFANAKTEQELNEGMDKLVNAISRLNMNPIEDDMLIFMASAGLLMANADGTVTEKEYERILDNMSNYYMFPVDILKQVTPENCSDLFNQSVGNILKENPQFAPNLFGYLVYILVGDQNFDKRELDLLFQMGQQAMGLDQETMLKLLASGIQEYFIPSIGSIS